MWIECAVTSSGNKKKIGYLPEANPIYPDMYVREYLDFVADVHDVPDKKKKIEATIGTVGLTPGKQKKNSGSFQKDINKE